MMNVAPARRVKSSFDNVSYMGASTVSETAAGQTAAFIFKGIKRGRNGHTGFIALDCLANVYHGDKSRVQLFFSPEQASAMQKGIEGAVAASNASNGAASGAAVSIRPTGCRSVHEIFVPAACKDVITSFHVPVQPRRSTAEARKEARMQRRYHGPANTNG